MPTAPATGRYFTVPLEDLRTATVLGFDLYIRHLDGEPVLYRSSELDFTAAHRDRLIEGGISEVHVLEEQREQYEHYAQRDAEPDSASYQLPPMALTEEELQLQILVSDTRRPLAERCETLLDVTRNVVEEALEDLGTPGLPDRLHRIAETTAKFLLENPAAFSQLVDRFHLDFATYNHSTHTALYTLELARCFGVEEPSRLAIIGRAALLHDVGKGEIPSSILHKQGPLDDLEWAEVMTHPSRGVELLKTHGWTDEVCLAVCGMHHERWDGSGYPQGLVGEVIPLEARMVAITDTFDALTSELPYRPAMSGFQALWKMSHEMTGQFDPRLMQCFIDAMSRSDV